MVRFLAGGLLAAMALPIAANAATIVTGDGNAVVIIGDSAVGYSETVRVSSAVDGQTLALTTTPGSINVNASSTDTLSASGQGPMGFATIQGAGGAGFSNITIDPLAPSSLFSAMQFNLAAFKPDINGNIDYRFDVIVTTLNSIEKILDISLMNQSDKFDILGSINLSAGLLIDKVTLQGLQYRKSGGTAWTDGRFDTIKQISFAPKAAPPVQNAIPEPGTWLMMIFGFGAIGMMLRRRGRNVVGARRVLLAS